MTAGIDDAVQVTYGHFYVYDNGTCWFGHDDTPMPDYPPGDDLVGTAADWISVAAGAQHHLAGVRLEAWTAEPARRTGWEIDADFTFTATTGQLYLNAVMGNPSPQQLTIGPAGKYHGRVYSRGRQDALHADNTFGSVPDRMEQYLLQFWPA